jgi:hypothetical protein
MKAKMEENLIERYKAIMPDEYNEEIGAFLKSIEGKEVELRFIGPDAFEVVNDDIWLPDCLWEKTPVDTSASGMV